MPGRIPYSLAGRNIGGDLYQGGDAFLNPVSHVGQAATHLVLGHVTAARAASTA